jgi:hypothetical protein
MASTGLDSFTNPAEIGALYPGVGAETAMLGILVALWLAWHFVQVYQEESEYREAVKHYREVGMERAMHHAAGTIATEDEVKIAN